MKTTLRTLAALAICLSGWALVPWVSMPAQAFSWQLFANAYGEIFNDGFESGDTSQWSNVVGGIQALSVDSTEDLHLSFRIDESSWPQGESEIVTLITGVSDLQAPTFVLEGRRLDGRRWAVRARTVRESNVWVESPWRELASPDETLDLEWRRAHEQLEDGLFYLSVDGQLLLWLVDLDNGHLPLRKIHLQVFDGGKAVTIPSEVE